MKRKVKGIIVTVFFGTILLTSTAMFALPSILPSEDVQEITKTGTPADNFLDAQRAQFCGTGTAKSNTYIKEFKIPTECTQPLAIVTDHVGNVWFAQSNTGNIAKFDPVSETFFEYKNPIWPKGVRSMMWGMDYSPDGSIWYTDEASDSVWKFSIQNENYQRLDYPSEVDSFPQRIQVEGSQIIVNDFTGNKITFFDAAQSSEELTYLSLPSPVENSITSDFVTDSNDNLWYTNWIFQQDGVLVRFDQQDYFNSVTNNEEELLQLGSFLDTFKLPLDLNTPNGIAADLDGNIWIADTSSSYFFSFDPESESFTKYITSPPTLSVYGNSSGLTETPITRPYWIQLDDDGRLVFNEQTANRIGIFDPKTELLIEYMIPSKNPNWADCGLENDCGLAQVLDFIIHDEKIWFTEWVENNIGVLDTSIMLPFELELESTKLNLQKGQTDNLILKVLPLTNSDIPNVTIISANTAKFSDIEINTDIDKFQLDFDGPRVIQISITANESALGDTHKILIGAQTDEVTIAKYVTLTIEP